MNMADVHGRSEKELLHADRNLLIAKVSRLTAGLKAHMQACTRCRGKVKYMGKDFEDCECDPCKAARSVLKGE